ncbi:hypothetical protein [Candidatus Caldatribacterium sp.]|uniref:hypothetical protein n=1 Tax=Candidatus Caldatribacterium sp. TaxID=2282143 RepID=UPI00299A2647|nr:hypothetical protein [Candidatus Caldatribacterium sp.]MDW8081607.1 hypothetical protein [Candidatus Calescibacterium sp.]
MRRYVTWIVLFGLLLWVTGVWAEEGTVVSPIVRDVEEMEKVLYGTPQSGSVLSRVEKIEKDLMGDTLSGTLMERVGKLKTFILDGTKDEPSLAFKMRAIRLTLQSGPSKSGILLAELEDLERLIFGVASNDPIGVRVDRLYKTCVDPKKASSFTVLVPKGTLVKVALETDLNSEKNEAGDPVPYVVLEDVRIEGVLVIAKNTRGEGRITRVRRRGAFGRPGRIEIDFGTVEAVDGTRVPLTMGERAIQENKAMAYAVGASIAGLAIFGPVGAVAGVFVQGEPAKVEKGKEFYLEVAKDCEVAGPLEGLEGLEGALESTPEPPASEEEESGEVILEATPQPEEEVAPSESPQVEIEILPFEEW